MMIKVKDPMKSLQLLAVVIASLALSMPVLAKKDDQGGKGRLLDNAVSVTVYNVATQTPQSTFDVGDTVGYTVEALLPPEADSKKVDIDVSLSINVRGIDLPFEISQKVSGPITGIDSTTGTGTSIPGIFQPVSKSGEFVISAKLSGSSVTIKAKLSIKDVGSTTVQQSITIN